MPGKRQAGWPFSLVTFSLATQRESEPAAAGRRKLGFERNQSKSIARKRAPTRVFVAGRSAMPAFAGMTEVRVRRAGVTG
jgi:hypothetical protein